MASSCKLDRARELDGAGAKAAHEHTGAPVGSSVCVCVCARVRVCVCVRAYVCALKHSRAHEIPTPPPFPSLQVPGPARPGPAHHLLGPGWCL
jgi:hypothetical protein